MPRGRPEACFIYRSSRLPYWRPPSPPWDRPLMGGGRGVASGHGASRAVVRCVCAVGERGLGAAGGAAGRLPALGWLHPAERPGVKMRLAADERMSAEAATRRARVDLAARRLFRLRRALG